MQMYFTHARQTVIPASMVCMQPRDDVLISNLIWRLPLAAKKLFVIIINDGSHSSIVSPTAKKDGRFLQFMDKKDIVVIGVQGVSPSNVSALQKNHVQKHLSVT
eukprot:scpid57289/ scgid0046/ 